MTLSHVTSRHLLAVRRVMWDVYVRAAVFALQLETSLFAQIGLNMPEIAEGKICCLVQEPLLT